MQTIKLENIYFKPKTIPVLSTIPDFRKEGILPNSFYVASTPLITNLTKAF